MTPRTGGGNQGPGYDRRMGESLPPDELGPVSIDDPELDVESLMREIRQTVADKRAAGVYSAEFLALLEEPLEIEPDPTFVAGPVWEDAVRSTVPQVDLPPVSRRPVVG